MKVLFCGEYLGSERSQDVLRRLIPDAEIVTCARSAVRDRLAGVDVVCPWGASVDASAMDAGTFGLVQQFGVGLEKVDVAAATNRGIWVARLPGELTGNADSVAETAVLHLLALSRRLDEARQRLSDGGWGGPVGRALTGKTVLIVGLGAIGSAVAARLRPFGVRLTGIRAHPERGGPVDEVAGPEDLHEMLGEADAVICAAMYDGSDARLFGSAAFSAMRPGALFVNVARGGLVDERALVAALDSGQVSGAGLDVFDGEPHPGPLARHPRVLATPHMGALTDHMLQLSARLFTENIQRWATGEDPRWAVNHPATPR